MLGTALCAPPGGGAKDVKLMPPVGGVNAEFWNDVGRGDADGNRGAGGKEKEFLDPFSFSNTVLFCIVDLKLTSNA